MKYFIQTHLKSQTYVIIFFLKGKKTKEDKQEVGDELRICVLNLLPEVTTLLSLAISLVKVKIIFFSIYRVTLPLIVMSKGP